MFEIRKTEIYAQWLDELRDIRARARVQVRVERLAAGNAGDAKPVGEGASELRIDYGPGLPGVFHKARARRDNSAGWRRQRHQSGDIKTALRLARKL